MTTIASCGHSIESDGAYYTVTIQDVDQDGVSPILITTTLCDACFHELKESGTEYELDSSSIADNTQEIERKFLVASDSWRDLLSAPSTTTQNIKQGYLNVDPERTTRVRASDTMGYLTIKGKAVGLTRSEYEYEIPLSHAHDLIKMCGDHVIEKTRHRVIVDNTVWEIDVFHGSNEGLVLAEVELVSENQIIILPEWVGEEVSYNSSYCNSTLAQPYRKTW